MLINFSTSIPLPQNAFLRLAIGKALNIPENKRRLRLLLLGCMMISILFSRSFSLIFVVVVVVAVVVTFYF